MIVIVVWLVLFLFALANDILWVNYTIATAEKRPLRSATWAFLIYLPVGVITPTLAHHPLFVFPLAAGAFVGTLLTVWWSRRKDRRQRTDQDSCILDGPLLGSVSRGNPT